MTTQLALILSLGIVSLGTSVVMLYRMRRFGQGLQDQSIRQMLYRIGFFGLCVYSLSVGITLAILNVHALIGFLCFGVALIGIGSIVEKINKYYWSKRRLIVNFTRKDGKFHIEHSKMTVTDQKDDIQGQDQVKW